jgi:hypothetical protein
LVPDRGSIDAIAIIAIIARMLHRDRSYEDSEFGDSHTQQGQAATVPSSVTGAYNQPTLLVPTRSPVVR